MSTEDTKFDFELILLTRKGLEKDLTRLREKWDIPAEGVSNEDSGKWWSNLVKKADAYKGNEYDKNPLNAFYNDVKGVLEAYDLDHSYEDVLRRYLIHGEPSGSFSQPANTSLNVHYKDWKPEKLTIEVYPHTTLDDIKNLWKFVETQKEKIWGIEKGSRRVKMPNATLNKRILKLANEGKTDKEIAQIINEGSGRNRLTYSGVAKMKNKIKKRVARKKSL